MESWRNRKTLILRLLLLKHSRRAVCQFGASATCVCLNVGSAGLGLYLTQVIRPLAEEIKERTVTSHHVRFDNY
jgi:hypothetical protein